MMNKGLPQVWRTILLGTHESGCQLEAELKMSGHGLYDDDYLIFVGNLAVAPSPIEIDLVVLSNAELGFSGGCTRAKTYEAGMKLGLALCPPEVGPQLRLQYTDQPIDESLNVAMEPVEGSYDKGEMYMGIFNVRRDERGTMLESHALLDDDITWHPSHRWVFTRPR